MDGVSGGGVFVWMVCLVMVCVDGGVWMVCLW